MSKPFRRNPPSRNAGKKILIACEGKYTEPKYFNAIRQDLRLSTVQVLVLPHEGTDPLSVVNAVESARRDEERGKNWDDEDSAWAVFDGDEHIANNLSNWHTAIQKAKSQEINLAITNPCMEFWYLIHFQDHFANISRSQAKTLLNNHIPSYDKSKCYYPELLKEKTEKALERANRLTSLSHNNNCPEYSNPCCGGISKLVKILLDLRNS